MSESVWFPHNQRTRREELYAALTFTMPMIMLEQMPIQGTVPVPVLNEGEVPVPVLLAMEVTVFCLAAGSDAARRTRRKHRHRQPRREWQCLCKGRNAVFCRSSFAQITYINPGRSKGSSSPLHARMHNPSCETLSSQATTP
eukprot:gene1378-biopygen8173